MSMNAFNGCELQLPTDFDDHGWEYEAKGRLAGVVVRVGGAAFTLVFYDPVRLGQDVLADVQSGAHFFESNLVVVETVTRVHIEAAVASLVAAGALR